MEKNPQSSPEAPGPQLHESAAGETDQAAKREQRAAETVELIDQIERGQLNRRDRQNAEDDLLGNLEGMHLSGDEEGLSRVHSALEDRMRMIADAGKDPREVMPFGFGVWAETTSEDRQKAFAEGRDYRPRQTASTEAPKTAAAASSPNRRQPYVSPDLEDTQPFAAVPSAANTRKHPYGTAPAPEADPAETTGPIPRVAAEPYEALRNRMAAQTTAATTPEASQPDDGEEEAAPYQRRAPEDVLVWSDEKAKEDSEARIDQAPNVVESVDGANAADITREAVRLSHLVEKYYKVDPEYVLSLVEEVEKKIDKEPNEDKKIAWIAALQLMEETAQKIDQDDRGRHSRDKDLDPDVRAANERARNFLRGVDPRREANVLRQNVRAAYDNDRTFADSLIAEVSRRYNEEKDPELRKEWKEALDQMEAAYLEAQAQEKKEKKTASKADAKKSEDDPKDKPEDVKLSASIRAQYKILQGIEWLGQKARRYRVGKIAVAAAGIGVAFYGVRQGWFSDRDIMDHLPGADLTVLPTPGSTGEDALTNMPDITPQPTPERVVEEVPVPIPKAAINIEAGEGFVQTMRELGIKGDTLRDLLNDDELRQKLIDMNVAYVMEDGSIGIALDAGDKMPKAALNAIREAAGLDLTQEVIKEVGNPPVETVTSESEATAQPVRTPQPETSTPMAEPGNFESALSDEDMQRLWLGGAAVATLAGGVALGRAYRRRSRTNSGRHRRPEGSEEKNPRVTEDREANEETAEFRMPLFAEDRPEPQIAAEILSHHLHDAENPSIQDIYDSYAELAGRMEPAAAVRAMNQALRSAKLADLISFKFNSGTGRVTYRVPDKLAPEMIADRLQKAVRA